MEQYTPDALLSRLGRISRQQRWAFAGAWLAGLCAHGYMFANKLPNHDDIAGLWDSGVGYTSGRWGLYFVSRLDGGLSTPWILGLLSLLFLAMAAMLLPELLQLKSPLFCGLAGGMLAAFPTVACTFSYMFTSDAYMLAFFLAVLCAWLCGRGGWHRRAAAVGCILLSLGLYQAYLGWAVSLMTYALLLRSLRQEADTQRIFLDGLCDLGVLAAGVGGYIGLTRYLLPRVGIALVSYQGLDEMGRIDPARIPRQLLETYRVFFGVCGGMTGGISTTPGIRLALTACQWLAILLIAAGAARRLAGGRWKQAGLTALLGLLMPIGINIVYLMNPGQVHSLMLYPMCMIPLVFLSQCDGWYHAFRPERPAAKTAGAAGRWASACLAALLLGRYVLLDNEAYLQMQLGHSRRIAYWTGIVTGIKSTPGYDSSLPLVMVQENGWDPTVPVWWPTDNLDDMMGVRMGMHYEVDAQFMDQFIGFAPVLLDPAGYAPLPEVQAMPPYPASGSIRIVEKDGAPAVVVKF